MTVRQQFAVVLAAAALLLGEGCGGRESTVFTAETDDRFYQEGQRLVRQGREAEALSAFLKVIEKRGEQASAESHLEAGLICLNHIKDPIEAIHHFRKYLELQPNAKQAPGVRGLIDTAKREFARTLPAHPQESQAVGSDQSDQVRQLQRENDDLRAELAAQRTATTTQFIRSSRATIDAPEIAVTVPPANPPPLITPAPARAVTVEPPLVSAPPSATKPAFNPVGAAPKPGRAAAPSSPGGRKHTVAPGETLFSISKKYGMKVEELQAANRSIVPSLSAPLPRGAELRIP
jgi:LysM repeat protein